jgi:hypothetical protein
LSTGSLTWKKQLYLIFIQYQKGRYLHKPNASLDPIGCLDSSYSDHPVWSKSVIWKVIQKIVEKRIKILIKAMQNASMMVLHE